MSAVSHPPPDLQLPSALLSHPLPFEAATLQHSISTLLSSSSRQSSIAVGTAFKLSSDGRSVRRLKGLLPILVKGHVITLVNPSTQTPVQSFTLSPSDQPCTAPLVLFRSLSGGKSIRTTYVGFKSGSASGTASKTPQTELWAFVEQLSTKGKQADGNSVQKEMISIPGSIKLVHGLADGRIVLTHSDDSLTIVTHDLFSSAEAETSASGSSSLHVSQTISSRHKAQDRIHFHVSLLDPSSSQTLAATTSRIEEAALVGLRVSVTSAASKPEFKNKKATKPQTKNKTNRKSAIQVIDEVDASSLDAKSLASGPLHLDITALSKPVDSQDDNRLRIFEIGSIHLSQVKDASEVLDCQLHSDGRLLVLTRSGRLISSMLTLTSGKPDLAFTKVISLSGLELSASLPSYSASILPLSKDHVLIVGVSKQNKTDASENSRERMVALLMDVNLDAVLAQMDWQLPVGAQGNHGQLPCISLSRVAGSLAIIQIDPQTNRAENRNDSARVNVLAMPFVVPDQSILRHAMGKGSMTARWIHTNDSQAPGLSKQNPKKPIESGHLVQVLEDGRRKLIESLEKVRDSANTNLKASAQQMEELFSRWLDTEAQRDTDRKVEAADVDRCRTNVKKWEVNKSLLDYNFVTALLPIVLPEPSSKPVAYPRQIVSTILQARAVSTTMLSVSRDGSASEDKVNNSSVLGRLRNRNDWDNIRCAIQHITDVSEADLVLLLADVLEADKKRAAKIPLYSGNNKRWKQPPNAVTFLSLLVPISVSRPLLRAALKARIKNTDDVVILLEILKSWLDTASRMPLDWANVKNKNSPKQTPAIDHVIRFASDLLDTYFPVLISTSSTHDLLRSLSSTIQLYLSAVSGLVTLGAPLGAFAKLEEEQRLVDKQRQNNNNKTSVVLAASGAVASAGNLKSNNKNATAAAVNNRAETGGGLGIVLGTDAEKKTKRLEKLEESMLAGAYSFERLEI